MKFLAPIDLVKNQLLNAAMHNSAADPASPVQGQMYFNTTDKQLYFFNNTVWVNSASPDLSGYVAKATYDAYTVMVADVDNTPTVLTLAASTVLGRGPTGGIVAISLDNDISATSAAHDTIPSALAAKTYADTKQSALTFGIADTNKVQINSATIASGQFPRFTASGLEGRTAANVLSDIAAMPIAYLSTATALGTSDVLVPSQNAVKTYADTKQAALTFGIANTNALRVTDAAAAATNYAIFSATGIEGWTKAEVITDLAVIPTSYLDADVTLAANSDVKIATQKAVKAYVDGNIAAANALVYKGVISCAANPNYPAANAGDLYVVSAAGLIGGASGLAVDIGDMVMCKTDGTASNTHALVGAQWNVVERNLVGAVTGPASNTADGNIALFNGTTGKLIKDSTVLLSTLSPVAGSASITTVGTVGTGTWQAGVISSTYGGTGVNNGGRTLTISTNSGTISFTTAVTLTVAAAASVSGTNTGDQTTIVGITGTKAQFNTAVTDGDIVYSGDALGTPSSGNLSLCSGYVIPASNVTLAMMANLAANSIMGNNTAGAIAPKALTATEVRTLLNVADGATANVGTVVKYSTTIGDGTTLNYVVTHSLATRDLTVQIFETATPWARVEADVELTSTSTLTVKFASAPAAGAYRVVIQA